MKKIAVAAIAVVFVVLISLYFGSSTTGLFHSARFEYKPSEPNEKPPKWSMIGKVNVSIGNVSALRP